MPDIKITDLAVNHRFDPLGIPARPLLFTWRLDGQAVMDPSFGFEVVVGPTQDDVEAITDRCWTRTGISGPRTTYPGQELASRAVRFWQVRARTISGDEVWSPMGHFEIGLEMDDWSGEWMSAPEQPYRRDTWDPVPLFRTAFTLERLPEFGRAYVTALGIYRFWANGHEVTASALLRPGWTDYRIRLLHQTFDVGGLLREGENVLALALAKGWYAGRLGLQREPGFYGDRPALRFQLECRNGPETTMVATGGQWRVHHGRVLASDLLQGEVQDVRQEPTGWLQPEFDDSDWTTAELLEGIAVPIDPQPHQSPVVHDVIEGRLVWQHARGPAVYDFGQNLVGWTRVESETLPRADVIARHGEILTPDHLVYRDNLRTAFQEDRYTTGDDGFHRLEPMFTLHGFRYAEVWGLPSKAPDMPLEILDTTKVSAVAVDSGMRKVGSFESSDARLNALSRAVEWTIRDNFIEVITDCPQRDERLGWLGDAGVISRTSAYYFDVAAFVAKFVQDAADSQTEDGVVRSYVPAVPPGTRIDGAPGWADGYVRLVHLLASRYGDLPTAERHYSHLRRYLERVDADNPSGIRTTGVGSDFGDWLSLPEDPKEPPHPLYGYTGSRSTSSRRVVATAHTYRSYNQLAELADWLGDGDEADRCRQRAAEIASGYRRHFVDADGFIESDTQTVYAQAVGFGVLTGDDAWTAVGHLTRKLESVGHMTTGIHGTEHVLPVLAAHGHADLAMELLLREEMPSWLHMVANGATTIWEKWDGLASDGTLSTAEMNSFNHCALGAVGQFLFEGVGGVDMSQAVDRGVIRIRPVYDRSLNWVTVSHDSPYGPVESSWRWDGDRVVHHLTIPPLLEVTVEMPTGFRLASAEAQATAGQTRLVVERG